MERACTGGEAEAGAEARQASDQQRRGAAVRKGWSAVVI